jgi:predicted RNA-binding Zn-ribbon protein involved in translation (DUF1610 family)
MPVETEKREHACPKCGSHEIRRSTRQGFMEKFVYKIASRGPYRCKSCDARFLDRMTGTSVSDNGGWTMP